MKPYKNRPKIIKGDKGIKTNDVVATFGLPEVNVYPDNKWGDIARSQGLETARNWRKVKEGTIKGINDFANDPRTQFVSMMLPLPQGLEHAGDFIGYLGKRGKQLFKSNKIKLGKNAYIDKDLYNKILNSKFDYPRTSFVETDPMKRKTPLSSGTDSYANLGSYLDYGEIPVNEKINQDYTKIEAIPDYMKRVKDFYNKDVVFRELNNPNTINFYGIKNKYLNTFGKIPIRVREYPSNKNLGGYANPKEIVIMRDNPGKFPVDYTLTHEGAHIDQFNYPLNPPTSENLVQKLLKRSFNTNYYTPEQKQLIRKIFKFDPEWSIERNIDELLEGGASIRDSRFLESSARGNIYGKDLDKAIDTMSTDDVLYNFSQGNGYSRHVLDNARKRGQDMDEYANWIKQAWKTIPAMLPFTLNQNKK